MSSLNLGLIGNCNVAALIDREATIVWYCLPRIDGDPVFHQLLGAASARADDGAFQITVDGHTGSDQAYVENTAILRTVLHGEGGSVEIFDFAPRYEFAWPRVSSAGVDTAGPAAGGIAAHPHFDPAWV